MRENAHMFYIKGRDERVERETDGGGEGTL